MNYRLFASSSGERAFRKLPPQIKNHLWEAIQVLKTQPNTGESLKGKFHFLRSLHVTYHGTQYRVVYEVDEAKGEIYVLYMASRENFYRDLEHLKLRSFLRRAG